MKKKPSSNRVLDLERRVASLAQLEDETRKEGDVALSVVWQRLREKTEKELTRLTQSKKSGTL